jgi:sulfatase modifying factor 1
MLRPRISSPVQLYSVHRIMQFRSTIITNWWRYAKGADWRRPQGQSSTIKGREKHPAVHIASDDALAYAQWSGKRLPTEAEFEYAERAGLDRITLSMGDELRPGVGFRCVLDSKR